MPYKETTPEVAAPRSLQAYANAFKEQLKVKGYATQSIEYRYACLQIFLSWCQERGLHRIESITRPILQRYQRHLSQALHRGNKPYSIESQRHHASAIRIWFKFLMRENLLLYNPASELELPRRSKRLPKQGLTADEAEQVLMQPDIKTDRGIRDRTILEILYSTGIRRGELLNLKLGDIDQQSQVLSIREGKGRKDRYVPISERALIWLNKYIEEVRPYLVLPSSPPSVFLGETGQTLDPHHVGRSVKSYVKQSGINKEGSCHLFRHTVATLMLEGGADIRFIQQLLGHSSVSTTEVYTHVTIHKLKEVHNLTHPGNSNINKADDEIPTEALLLDELDREMSEETD